MTKKTKKLALIALLTAIALIIFIIEAQIPMPVPVPGVKLGLANIITLFALFYKKEKFSNNDVFIILLCRIVLGAFFTGRIIVLAYSLTGGMLGLVAQILIKRSVTNKQIWVCGVVGGILHNVGQILAAIIITGTPAIAAYLPILIISGILTGLLTGITAQIVVERLSEKPD